MHPARVSSGGDSDDDSVKLQPSSKSVDIIIVVASLGINLVPKDATTTSYSICKRTDREKYILNRWIVRILSQNNINVNNLFFAKAELVVADMNHAVAFCTLAA